MDPTDAFQRLDATSRVYASSDHRRRHFGGACGNGLHFPNDEILPGLIDPQSAANDDPTAIPAHPPIRATKRITSMSDIHLLPEFERYPPMD